MVRTRRKRYLPRNNKLLLLRTASTAAVEAVTGWTVNRQREQVLRLRKIRHQTGAHDEVAKTEKVDGEDENQDNVEDVLPALCVTGCVLLCDERCVEGLKKTWPVCDDVLGILLGILVPVVAEGCVDGANHDKRAGIDGKGFGHRWISGGQLRFVEGELSEDTSVGSVVINSTTVEIHG